MVGCSDEPLGRCIYRISLKLRNYAGKMLSPYELTVEQFHLLKSTSPTAGRSQNELCCQLGKKPANITRILDRLERKQWIRREPNPADRRSSLVFLTAEGQRIIDEVSSDFESYSSWFKVGIGRDDEQVFRKVLGTIDDNIDRMMDEIDRQK